jgi:hypothetical protein
MSISDSFALPEYCFVKNPRIAPSASAWIQTIFVCFSKPAAAHPQLIVRDRVHGKRFVGVAKNVLPDMVTKSARLSFEASRLGTGYT